jgi:hypothetical protein
LRESGTWNTTISMPASAGFRLDAEGAVLLSEQDRIAAKPAAAAEPVLRRLKNLEIAVERPIVDSRCGGYV